MAHSAKCFGIWRNSKLGGKNDGDIRIDEHSTKDITGRHFNSGTDINGTCDGTEQSFWRPLAGGKKMKYKNGKITEFGVGPDYRIDGKFEDESNPVPPAGIANKKSKTRASKKGAPLLPDDWEAEKTGA